MTGNTKILKDIEKRIEDFHFIGKYSNIGKIEKLSEGVAIVSGLSDVMMGELVEFTSEIKGVCINLKKNEVGVIVLGDHLKLKEGDEVRSSGKLLEVEVSNSFLGRVLDGFLRPIDGSGKVSMGKDSKAMLVEKIAPGIIDREPVGTPLLTGLTAIDSMIPIGRGQRELIVGDRNTGKTAIAVDTIINLSKVNKTKGAKRVISIYVGIGQKQSKIVQLVDKLRDYGALGDSIVISATSADPVSLQYLAPFVATAVGEYFMAKGEDVLIVYDDLTKHAWAYRQISLTLKRPSGREAYPGDIFYLHSKLLERSCKLSEKLGGGSLTAIPIIETQAQDISAFIPTNVISITDGQIYLESDLFYQGVRPAVNVGLSVSRVGGAAQFKAMKQVAGKLRLELAQYNELSAFAQFGSDLDEGSKSKIERGKRLIEVLKQDQYSPRELALEILAIWTASNGYLDTFPVDDISSKVSDFYLYVKSNFKDFTSIVYEKSGITKDVETKLNSLVKAFLKSNG